MSTTKIANKKATTTLSPWAASVINEINITKKAVLVRLEQFEKEQLRLLKTENRSPLTLTRRLSFTDDEGYLTAESSNCTSSGRKSRARTKTIQKTDRSSRSLSTRSTKTVDKFKTPPQNTPPSPYAKALAPKVKRHVFRGEGEVAQSLQEISLMTGNVVTDNMANIPLDDGRLLSNQPQRGLRMRQIPALDSEAKRKLEALRSKLNKVAHT